MKILCPICKKELSKKDKSMICENKHCFDVAKSGYLNLLNSSSLHTGDNKAMIQARSAFLDNGYYSSLQNKLIELLLEEPFTSLVDLGCGEGYYTNAFPCKEKIGFDLSKEALIHASKKDKITHYILASIFHLPLEKECTEVVLICFAPFAKEEVERILKPKGRFIFVSPCPRHLYELKEVLYDRPYENAMEELETSLSKEQDFLLKHSFICSKEGLENLFQMTPYAYKTGKEGKMRLTKIVSLPLSLEVRIRVFRKN